MEKFKFAFDFIERLGFPIFVAIFLLVRSEKRMERILEILKELIEVIRKR